MIYRGDGDNEIHVTQGQISLHEISGDGEDAVIKEMFVSGHQAMLVLKDDTESLYIVMDNKAVVIHGTIPQDELIHIGESLRRIE